MFFGVPFLKKRTDVRNPDTRTYAMGQPKKLSRQEREARKIHLMLDNERYELARIQQHLTMSENPPYDTLRFWALQVFQRLQAYPRSDPCVVACTKKALELAREAQACMNFTA